MTNRLDPDDFEDHAHPEMRTRERNLDVDWDRSERISLHPTQIAYNVLGSDGATVGFNFDQTVGPGESITYRWFADEPIGSVILWDHADIPDFGKGELVQPLPDNACKRKIKPEKRPGWNVARGMINRKKKEKKKGHENNKKRKNKNGQEGKNGHKKQDTRKVLLVGVPNSDIAGTNAGAAYLFLDPNDPIEDLLDYDAQILGNDAHDNAGMTVRIKGGNLVIEAGSFGKTVEKRYVFKNPGDLSGTLCMWETDEIIAVDEEDDH